MAKPGLDIGSRHVLGRPCHGALSPIDRTGWVPLDGAAAIEQHRQQPHGVGMASFGGPAQGRLRLRPRHELWLAAHGTIVGLVDIVDLVQRAGVASFAELAPSLERFRLAPIRAKGACRRRFQRRIVGLAQKALGAGLNPKLPITLSQSPRPLGASLMRTHSRPAALTGTCARAAGAASPVESAKRMSRARMMGIVEERTRGPRARLGDAGFILPTDLLP
jgi:hypothetical protein